MPQPCDVKATASLSQEDLQYIPESERSKDVLLTTAALLQPPFNMPGGGPTPTGIRL